MLIHTWEHFVLQKKYNLNNTQFFVDVTGSSADSPAPAPPPVKRLFILKIILLNLLVKCFIYDVQCTRQYWKRLHIEKVYTQKYCLTLDIMEENEKMILTLILIWTMIETIEVQLQPLGKQIDQMLWLTADKS